jgi:HEAT repeat protein
MINALSSAWRPLFDSSIAVCRNLLSLVLLLLSATALADDALDALVAGGELAKVTNPEPINFLLNEGRGRLPAATDSAAREQLTSALRLQTNPIVAVLNGMTGAANAPTLRQITEQTKQQMSPANVATTLAAGLLNVPTISPTVSPTQQQVQQLHQETQAAIADPWIRGMESAKAFVALGDAQSAGRFYTSCLGLTISVDWLPDACLDGILALGAPRALVLLTWIVEHAEQAVPGAGVDAFMGNAQNSATTAMVAPTRSAALRGLGKLIGTGTLNDAAREQAFALLVSYADGKSNQPYYVGAADGLGQSHDVRAVPVLTRFAKQKNDDALHAAATQALAIGFRDENSLKQLRSDLNDKDAERRFKAAALLFQTGDEGAFAWAVKTVTTHRAAEDTSPDVRVRVVRDLAEQGGERGHAALEEIHRHGAGNDWLQAWVAVALLEQGDTAMLEEVRAALGKRNWTLDSPGARAWWGRVSPLISLAVSAALTGGVDTHQVINVVNNMIAAERTRYGDHANNVEMFDAQMHWQAADAFAASGIDSTVADLRQLLSDERAVVRLSAARAIALHAGSQALDAIEPALATDFGDEGGVARAPEVRTALLRAAIERYPTDPRTLALCQQAATDADTGMRFIALVQLEGRKAG